MIKFQELTFRNYVIGVLVSLGTSLLLYQFVSDTFFKPKKKMARIMDTADIFKKSTVHMKNPDAVEEILGQLLKDGPTKLQVISDFDHTISRVHSNGVMCDTTYGILKSSGYTSEENKIQANLLFEKYYPIEIDPNLSREEKTPYMIEWYAKSRNLMLTSGVKKDAISLMVKSCSASLREGCDTMFKTLLAHDIPLLIFSAGIGDILEEILKQKNLLLENMKVIANFMDFDKEGNVCGFHNQFIHTFNKNQYSLKNSDYFDKLKSRKNIILLGDSLGDTDMSDGAQGADCIFKIGFLNKKIKENMPEYLSAYDVVLADDQTMDFMNGLLQIILQNTSNVSTVKG